VTKKVLMVVTSQALWGDLGYPTGFWISELTHPYFLVTEAGYDVEIASLKGGKAPIDPFSLPGTEHTQNPDDIISVGFLNSPEHVAKIEDTPKLAEVDVSQYDAIFFAGGTGAIYDYPLDDSIGSAIRTVWEAGKIVATVCHGGAALLNATLSNGKPLIEGMTVTAFIRTEEEYIQQTVPQYTPPVYLEDELPKRGATFVKGATRTSFAVTSGDGRLITGQNQFSGLAVGRKLVAALSGIPEVKRTMKILAIDHLLPGATEAMVMEHMPAEAEQAWQLMKAGVIRENYLRGDGHGAVAVLECADVTEAQAIMSTFPLVKAGLIDFDYIPLGAFTPLETLFATKS
jgi:putative intracellular protease/amidase